jgi:aldehyde dehydrogenase (NAD+)
LFLGKLMDELDLPPGVLNIVTGGGAVGAALVNHPGVDKIAFTGSSPTGQAILRASAGNLKRVTLELGGKSPDIIFADADLDKAAPAAAMGVFGNTGQMCIAGTRVYVQRPIYDEFIERMAKVANGLRVGHSLDPQTQIGPLASASHLARVEKFMTLGKESKIRLAAGGGRLTEGALAEGYFVQPTIFADTHDNMEIVREEIFGPVATVMPFDDFDEVIRRANDTPFGLACGIWTSNIARAHNAAAALRAGICWVNTFLKMDPNVPFGGYKMSGIGKELGAAGLDDYLIGKSVWIDTN